MLGDTCRHVLLFAAALLVTGCAAESDDGRAGAGGAYSSDASDAASGDGADASEDSDNQSAGGTSSGGTSSGTTFTDVGTSDSGPSADLGGHGDATTSTDAQSAPRCDASYRKLVNASGPKPRLAPIPWKVLSGPTPTHRKKVIEGRWAGTVELDESIRFECPATAGTLGLKCSTRQTFFIRREGGAENRVQIALSVPMEKFAPPEEGTPVRLTMVKEDGRNELAVRGASTGEWFFALRSVRSGNDQYGEPEAFVDDFDAFQISMRAPIDEAGSAFCLLEDHCDRMLRIEPLHVSAVNSTVVTPGGHGKFRTPQGSYRLWHLASYRRNQDLGGETTCTDVTYPAASYAFVRTK